nr:hypothetical protein [Mycoplasmopsis bovis]
MIKRIYDSKEVTLKYSPKLVEYIAKNAYDENFGARPIKRYIQNNIESVLGLSNNWWFNSKESRIRNHSFCQQIHCFKS